MHSISLAQDSNNMPKAYSEDLRWRAVWLNIVRGMSYKDIAFICEKSVQRYLTLFHGTGSVTPQPPTGGPSKVLNELEEFTVMQSIIHKPTLYLQEVQEHLYNATVKWVSASTICRTINAREFTRKKVQVIALQLSEQRRIEFMVQVAASYNPDMFI